MLKNLFLPNPAPRPGHEIDPAKRQKTESLKKQLILKVEKKGERQSQKKKQLDNANVGGIEKKKKDVVMGLETNANHCKRRKWQGIMS